MSEKKIKIKDLAEELKVRPDALLNTAKKEGINVAAAGTVTQEEAARLRASQAKQAGAGHKTVIVRRKAAQPKPEPKAPAAEAAGAEAKEQAAKPAQADNAGAAPAAEAKAGQQNAAPAVGKVKVISRTAPAEAK